MRSSRVAIRTLVCRVTVLGLIGCALGAATANAFELRLRSRTLTPEPGTAEAERYLESLPTERGHVLLQMARPDDAVERDLLEQRGVRFLQYLPEDTWMVSVPRDVFARPTTGLLVRWAGPILTDDRVHPRLRDAGPRGWAVTPEGHWRLFVRFFEDVELSDARSVLEAAGATVLEETGFLRAFEIQTDAAGLAAIGADDRVYWVRETAPPKVGDNDGCRANTGADVVNDAPYGLTGNGITVAVWDGGAVADHVDFGARLSIGDGATPDFHATHVGGTVAGNGTGSSGEGGSALQWAGMAPQAGLASYDWDVTYDEHALAIATYGASISQNSWSSQISEELGNCDAYGDYDFGSAEYDDIINGAAGGIILVAHSAGNERQDSDCGNPDYGTITPPSASKNTITVGAINSNNDSMTSFSGWGPVDDGRLKPELVGPGCQSGGDGGVTSTQAGDTYGTFCGTSMATPAVSGCVALVQGAYLDDHGTLPEVSLVRALLFNTARDLGNVGPDYSFGFGAIDVHAAVDQYLDGAWGEGTLDDASDTAEFAFDVPSGAAVAQVTIAWNDPAASPGALTTLINDLDLVLVSPIGTEYSPWDLTPSIPTLDAVQRPNHRDPMEQVTVTSPMAGLWTARVSATALPEGPQTFHIAGTSPEPPCVGITLNVPGEYATIQAAVNAANFCDTVFVGPGTFQEQVTISERIFLIGSGPGLTTLQAPSFQRAMEVQADANIENLTIYQGISFGSFPNGYGGGIFAQNVSPTIRNVTFRECVAQNAGGAVYGLQSRMTLESCVFDSCFSQIRGGAIGLDQPLGADITGSVFFANEAVVSGGAISIDSGDADVTSNTFHDNEAGTAGGAIEITGSATVSLLNNIVASGLAPSAGGIWCDGGTVTLDCNDLWNNTEDTAGCTGGPNDFSADPEFCDVAADDFRIALTSPCAPDQSPAGCGLVGARDAVDCSVVAVETVDPTRPRTFAVHGAKPNPLRAGTVIGFDLPSDENVRLGIFDVSGRLVRVVVNEKVTAGRHTAAWDGRDGGGKRVPSGVYFYDLRAGEHHATRKLVVLP